MTMAEEGCPAAPLLYEVHGVLSGGNTKEQKDRFSFNCRWVAVSGHHRSLALETDFAQTQGASDGLTVGQDDLSLVEP